MDPFIIVANGSQLFGWLEAELCRKRDDATGSLSFSMFFNQMPTTPAVPQITKGTEIQVYVAGSLAFNGTVDKREGASEGKGKGKHGRHHHRKHGGKSGGSGEEGGGSRSVSIGPDKYEIKFEVRGKCKSIADVSHTHPTGSMKNATPTDAITALLQPQGLEVDDQAGLTDSIDRWFTDGGNIGDEIHSILQYSGASMFESVDGKLTLATHGASGNGDDLVLGQNILEFSASQTEEFDRSDIKIKGNSLANAAYGRQAVTTPAQALQVPSVSSFRPYVGQIAGDATNDRLQSAAQNEAASREQKGKTIELEVFHVQQPSGDPWDLNITHYVEIPPENVFDSFVVTELKYNVSKDELKTTLTLAPLGATDEGGNGGSGAVSGMIDDAQAQGLARRAQLGVPYTSGTYPSPWNDSAGTFAAGGIIPAPTVPAVISYPPLKIGGTS